MGFTPLSQGPGVSPQPCHNGSVVEHYNASVGSRFDVYTTIFAKLIVCASEVVAYCLGGDIKTVGDLAD